jgi:hypothetical protein
MPAAYTYLLSSLPALFFNARAPFSYDRFLEQCAGLIPAQGYALLEAIGNGTVLSLPRARGVLEQWVSFETALRNELVRLRADRIKAEPQRFLRGEAPHLPDVHTAASNAYRMPSVLDTEKSLDAYRWQKLEELGFGHFFDFDALIVYALKLMIVARWDSVSKADSAEVLRKTIEIA